MIQHRSEVVDPTRRTPWRGLSQSPRQTAAIGGAIASSVKAGDQIALIGQLGAGKTQLVRGLVAALGIDASAVSSPTFVLMQQYRHAQGQPVVIHVDAYRLVSGDDADSIGWDTDLLSAAVVVVEWADRLSDRLAHDRLTVELDHVDKTDRDVSVVASGTWCSRMSRLCEALDHAVGAPVVDQAHQE